MPVFDAIMLAGGIEMSFFIRFVVVVVYFSFYPASFLVNFNTKSSSKVYTTGTTIKVSNKDEKIPPTVAIAIGFLVSDPGPIPKTMGNIPNIVENAVIRIGRNRTGDACKTASFLAYPCPLNVFV